MQDIKLGRTGLKVSRLCLGTMTFGWSSDEETSFAIMDTALDAGINFFDSADIYSRWIEGNNGGDSEKIIGKWLKTKNRRDIIIATKTRAQMWDGANGQGLSRSHIIHAVEDSLRRLQTDYIDLYQTHWPDDETPMDETLLALDNLVKSGKVRYIGTSNHPPSLMVESLWISDIHKISRYETLQPHYSMLHRKEYELELEKVCKKHNIGVIPYSPLAAGFLTGKYSRENKSPDSTRSSGGLIQNMLNNEKAYIVLDRVMEIADGYNVPPAQIALAWMLTKPTITAPIVGARTVEQLNDVIGATDLSLTDAEIQTLDEVSDGF
jgi:aryl-alcohol dehydrogenase-like predicted oxidoreductase